MRVFLPILVVALVAITVVIFVLPRSEPPETPDGAPSSPTKPQVTTKAAEDGPDPALVAESRIAVRPAWRDPPARESAPFFRAPRSLCCARPALAAVRR